MGDLRMTAKLIRGALPSALVILGILLLANTADGCGFASLWKSSVRENKHHVQKRAMPLDTPSEWGSFIPEPVSEKKDREERQLTKELQDVLCLPGCVHGDCIGMNTCLCHEGYHGYTCENALCNPECMNGGVCTAPYQCECPSGFKGDRCQTAVCSPPCENGGVCTQPNVCTCPAGYKGNHCATPICTNGCQNEGLCVAPEQCSCKDGWTGQACETPTCDEPCLHGGTCIAPNECACSQHYGGTRCQFSLFDNDDMQQFGAASTHPGRVCSAWSGRHFLTFDGRYFDFPAHADCSYLLAGDCIDYDFNVMVREDGECTEDRCTLRIDLRVKDTDITIQHKDGHHVTVNDKRVSLPYSYQGVNVESTGAYVRLYSATGVMVSWDGQGSVYVELDTDHHNKTCGLCGNFNGIDADDYRSRSGELLHNTMEFGNNWRMTGAQETCPYVPFDTPGTCAEVPADELQELFQICSVLSESADFRPCRNAMDPTPYVHACVSDLCSCAYESRDDCLCGALTQYSRACAHTGVVLSWRSQDFCWNECPAGKMYEECGTACPRTCRNLDSSYACAEHCVDGCFCPPGTVHHGNDCVQETNCTCLHNGREYQPGQTTRQGCNQCFCEGGRWTCTEHDCPATCSATGDPHYVSFDGRRFTFMGDCQYVLAKDCGRGLFSVFTENLPCGLDSAVTCTKTGTIVLKTASGKDVMVTFHQGGSVSVANVGVTLPYVQDDIVIHRSSSMFVTLTSSIGLIVEWDGETRMYVTVSPDFKGQTCGLCGNFNGNQLDDFTVKGMPETSVAAFGNSWKANADCLDVPRDQILEACAVNTQRADYANSMCGVINSPIFAACHRVVRPDPYFKECLFDVCECEMGERCLCSAVANYARACARNYAPVEWRSPELCPVECSGGQELQQCGSSCRTTCRSLSDPIQGCDDECVEGCNCPQGLFLDEDDNCVLPSECPCYHNGELYRPNEAIHRKGSTCYCQDGVMECYDSSVEPTEDKAVGGLRNREGRFAMCIPPMFFFSCFANPGSKGTECRTTCQNMHINDQCISNQCISGCMCAGGLVQDGYDCVLPYECPCYHNGQSYQSGETIQLDCNQCTCQGGDWQCSTHDCTATCTAYGESHYISFDGYRYQFYGACTYEFATDFCGGNEGTFRVQIQNERCGLWGTTCIKTITITLETVQIIFYKDRPGEPEVRPRPGIHDPCVTVTYNFRRVGFFLILTTDHGLTVMWDFGTRVYVTLSPEFRGHVCGLCGNFDGNQANDFTTRALDIAVQPEQFAASWQVNPLCVTTLDSKDDQNGTALHISPCLLNLHRLPWARRQCAIIHAAVFQPCHYTIDPQPWYEACVDDTCSCDMGGDCECFCTAVAAYAHACGEAGIPIRWRTPELCPTQCEDYNAVEVDCVWHYHPCGQPCEETCQNPDPSTCTLPCLAGCHPTCPNGTLLNEYTRECVEVCPTTLPVIVPSCTTTPPMVTELTSEVPTTTRPVVPTTTTSPTTPGRQTTTPGVPTTTSYEEPPTSTPVVEVFSTTTPEVPTTTQTVGPTTTIHHCCEWSDWMNSDNIIDTNDNETYPHLRDHYYMFCGEPEAIQCRTVDVNSEGQHLDVAQAGQVGVICDASVGLLCLGDLQLYTPQKVCFDYEVRVLCCDLCTTTGEVVSTTTEPRQPPTTTPGEEVVYTTTEPRQPPTTTPGEEVVYTTTEPRQPPTTTPGEEIVYTTTEPRQPPTTTPGEEVVYTTTEPRQPPTTTPGEEVVYTTTEPRQPPTTTPGEEVVYTTTEPRQPPTTTPGEEVVYTTTEPRQPPTTTPGEEVVYTTTEPRQPPTTTPGEEVVYTTTEPRQPPTTTPGEEVVYTTTEPRQPPTTTPGEEVVYTTTEPRQPPTTTPGEEVVYTTTEPRQPPTTTPGEEVVYTTTEPRQPPTTTPGEEVVYTTTEPRQPPTTTPGEEVVYTTTEPRQPPTTTPGEEVVYTTTEPRQPPTTTPGEEVVYTTTEPRQPPTTTPGEEVVYTTTEPRQPPTTTPGEEVVYTTTEPRQPPTTTPGEELVYTTTEPRQPPTTTPGEEVVYTTTEPRQPPTTTPGEEVVYTTTEPRQPPTTTPGEEVVYTTTEPRQPPTTTPGEEVVYTTTEPRQPPTTTPGEEVVYTTTEPRQPPTTTPGEELVYTTTEPQQPPTTTPGEEVVYTTTEPRQPPTTTPGEEVVYTTTEPRQPPTTTPGEEVVYTTTEPRQPPTTTPGEEVVYTTTEPRQPPTTTPGEELVYTTTEPRQPPTTTPGEEVVYTTTEPRQPPTTTPGEEVVYTTTEPRQPPTTTPGEELVYTTTEPQQPPTTTPGEEVVYTTTEPRQPPTTTPGEEVVYTTTEPRQPPTTTPGEEVVYTTTEPRQPPTTTPGEEVVYTTTEPRQPPTTTPGEEVVYTTTEPRQPPTTTPGEEVVYTTTEPRQPPTTTPGEEVVYTTTEPRQPPTTTPGEEVVYTTTEPRQPPTTTPGEEVVYTTTEPRQPPTTTPGEEVVYTTMEPRQPPTTTPGEEVVYTTTEPRQPPTTTPGEEVVYTTTEPRQPPTTTPGEEVVYTTTEPRQPPTTTPGEEVVYTTTEPRQPPTTTPGEEVVYTTTEPRQPPTTTPGEEVVYTTTEPRQPPTTTPGEEVLSTTTREVTTTTSGVPTESTIHPCCEWSDWMNSDNIIDTSDNETYHHLRDHYYSFCLEPEAIQCRTVDVNSEGQHLDVAQAGQVGVVCDASVGLLCLGELQLDTPQKVCFDYEVRVLCCDLCTTTGPTEATTPPVGPTTTPGLPTTTPGLPTTTTCPPCYVNGIVRPSGDSWSNTITACTTCTCECGQVLCQPLQCPAVTVPECVNGADPEYVEDPDNPCCRIWQCPCDCFLYGEPHYSTCDGRRFSHQGNCTYLMAKPIGSDEFQIWAQNFPCTKPAGAVATCTRSVSVIYGGFEVELGRTGVAIVNGQPLRPPVSVGGMTITRHGYHTMRLVIDALGVIVNYIELNYIASIYIPPEFFEDIEGLCGFYDNDQSNDFTLTDGSVTTDTEDFGYDWLVEGELEDCYVNTTDCVLGNVTTACEILATDVFEPCHDVVEYWQFLEDCEFDVCMDTSPCYTITAYAMACLEHEVCIDWRDLVPECPSQCPPDRIYTPCGTTCPATCQDQTASCGSGFMEDCACPDGFVLDVTTGDCIRDELCACVDHNNVPRQPGESWNVGPCRECTCNETANGDYIVSCHDITTCPTSCPPCYTLENSPGTCCGECVKTSCCEITDNGNVIEHAVNSTWSPGNDLCEVCECREMVTTGEAFEICSTIQCPDPGPTYCDEGQLVTESTVNGCCSFSYCTPPQSACVRYENQTELTVNGCTSAAPVTITWCEGRCPSGSHYHPESNSYEQECSCCGPAQTDTTPVDLTCSDGTVQTHYVTDIVSCDCEQKTRC
ncbi:mucin-2-like isoform X2 [Branchiostoma lanceolatum]|uniref:mucin-2-like isoform X2 n=1 Tax=Branchiostoma lanceolatum TaxID=7740 RepID=UPI003452345E